MAECEIVAEFKLVGISRAKVEHLIHRVFGSAQIDIVIPDRFGKAVKPKEWFLAPLHIIQEAVNKIADGSIIDYVYDPTTAEFILVSNQDS